MFIHGIDIYVVAIDNKENEIDESMILFAAMCVLNNPQSLDDYTEQGVGVGCFSIRRQAACALWIDMTIDMTFCNP